MKNKIKFDFNTVTKFTHNSGPGGLIEHYLGGHDKMLAPLDDLSNLDKQIAGARRALSHNERVLNSELYAAQSYLRAVIDCRTSLQAAGLETPA
jgi:hypothetical protein